MIYPGGRNGHLRGEALDGRYIGLIQGYMGLYRGWTGAHLRGEALNDGGDVVGADRGEVEEGSVG